MRLSLAALIAVLVVAPAAMAQTTDKTQQDHGAPAERARQLQYYTHQGNEMRASMLIGAPVRNKADDRIGEVNEVILSKDGKVAALVVGVGGFLGIGEREVALGFSSVRIEQDTSATAREGSVIVKVDVTKETLNKAPAWTWSGRGATTTTPPSGQGTPPAGETAPRSGEK